MHFYLGIASSNIKLASKTKNHYTGHSHRSPLYGLVPRERTVGAHLHDPSGRWGCPEVWNVCQVESQ